MKTLINTVNTLQAQKRLKLTPRESEILEKIAFGNSQKETAALLGISVFTVDVHIKHIKLKTGLQKMTELTAAWFCKHYNVPTLDIPARTRRRIATALLALSVFSTVIQTTEMVRVFRTSPARRVASRTARRGRKNTDFNYLPLTA